jgi:hypothetical protein
MIQVADISVKFIMMIGCVIKSLWIELKLIKKYCGGFEEIYSQYLCKLNVKMLIYYI